MSGKQARYQIVINKEANKTQPVYYLPRRLLYQPHVQFCYKFKKTTIPVFKNCCNTLIDKHQPTHFTFNNILVQNADFNVKIYKNT